MNQRMVAGLYTPTHKKQMEHHGEVVVGCPWCGHFSDTLDKLSQHKRQQHKAIRLRCFLCEFSSRNLGRWASHMTSNHAAEISLLVGLANFSKVSNSGCQQHQQDNIISKLEQPNPSQAEDDTIEVEPILKFSCTVCGYSTSKKRKLTKHLEREHKLQTSSREISSTTVLSDQQEQNGVKCPYCGSFHPSFSDTTKHCKTEHNINSPFTCTECKRQFQCISKLVSHMRKHSGEKPFFCNICSYKTSLKNSLILHMRTHTDYRPFKCELCEFATKTSSDLIVHKRMHANERPYICKYCKYRSGNATNLSRHMKLHTNTRPHKCKICDYAAIQKAYLVAHMRKHTGEKPFVCKLCLRGFTTSWYLNKHKKISDCSFHYT